MKQYAILVCAALTAVSAVRAETLRLDLDGATALAAENNLNLRKGMVDLRSAEMKFDNRWALVIPEISASAGVNYSRTFFTDPVNPNADDNPLRYSSGVSLSLQLNAGIPFAVKNIVLAYQAQEISYETAFAQIGSQTAKSFYSLITGMKNLEVLKEEVALAGRQLEKSETAFRNGLAGERALLQARLGVETAKLNLHKAEAAHRANQDSFVLLLGLDPGTTVELEGSLSLPPISVDADALIGRYLPGRSDIRRQKITVESASNAAAQGALSAKGPRISLSAGWSGQRTDRFSDGVSAGLSVGIPLDPWIPGSKSDQTTAVAASELEKARMDLRMLENQAALEIRKLVYAVESAGKSIGTATLRVNIAERSYALADAGFQSGTLERLEYETARKDLIQAKQQLLSEELAHIVAAIDLADALNITMNELIGRTR